MQDDIPDPEWLEHVFILEGAQLRSSVTLTEADVERLLQAAMARSRRSRWTPSEAQWLLRRLLEPFCGPGMARAAIELAVRRSTADDRPVGAHYWPVFISNLTESVGAVCGLAAAGLVGCAGRHLSIEA
jgi:hypothetical protein